MKRLFIAATTILLCASAFAAFGALEKEWVKDSLKYCKYSNGVILTVKAYELCPITID